MGETSFVIECLSIVAQSLSTLAIPLINQIVDHKTYGHIIMGLSNFINEDWENAAKQFNQVNVKDDHLRWQVKYIMALALIKACNDTLPDEFKVLYGNKAMHFLSDISSNLDIPSTLIPEIILRIGSIKKVVWFAHKQWHNLQLAQDNESDEIIDILNNGLSLAIMQNKIDLIEEYYYQLGCTYAIAGNRIKAQLYYKTLGVGTYKGEKLRERIKKRYNTTMFLEGELEDS